MATPIIRALKRRAIQAGWGHEGWLILDAPPGTSCPVIEALRGADVALLVTEPTPFGLHDLKMAVEVARDTLHLPVGIVLNKDGIGDDAVANYCQAEGLPILMRLPMRREIAVAYSTGQPLVRAYPEYRADFQRLMRSIVALAQGSAS
jgi:MinD superfamily P-loop ATPase